MSLKGCAALVVLFIIFRISLCVRNFYFYNMESSLGLGYAYGSVHRTKPKRIHAIYCRDLRRQGFGNDYKYIQALRVSLRRPVIRRGRYANEQFIELPLTLFPRLSVGPQSTGGGDVVMSVNEDVGVTSCDGDVVGGGEDMQRSVAVFELDQYHPDGSACDCSPDLKQCVRLDIGAPVMEWDSRRKAANSLRIKLPLRLLALVASSSQVVGPGITVSICNNREKLKGDANNGCEEAKKRKCR